MANQEELHAYLQMSPSSDTETDEAEARVAVCQVVGAYSGQERKLLTPQGPFQRGVAVDFSLLPEGGAFNSRPTHLYLCIIHPVILLCCTKTQ